MSKAPIQIDSRPSAIAEVPPVKAKRAYRNSKRVPSAVPAARRAEALRAVRAGRSLHQESCEMSSSSLILIEEWLRNLDRRITDIEYELRGRKAA